MLDRLRPTAQDILGRGLRNLAAARARTERSTGRLRPTFLIIGAQRSGTTSLYRYLIQHPGVARALTKEVHYFDVNFSRGREWYEAHFPSDAYAALIRRTRGHELVTGEASPYYLFHPLAPARAKKMLPDAKLIVMLRDPVARSRSHHRHEVALGVEKLPFDEAIEREPARLDGEVERILTDPAYNSFNHQHFSYAARGEYLEQILRWREHFPDDQMLVVNSDEFFADTAAGHRRVLEFLDLPFIPLRAYKRHNTYRPLPTDDQTVRSLVAHFKQANEGLYNYAGIDFGWAR